jgi:hypothetical protein
MPPGARVHAPGRLCMKRDGGSGCEQNASPPGLSGAASRSLSCGAASTLGGWGSSSSSPSSERASSGGRSAAAGGEGSVGEANIASTTSIASTGAAAAGGCCATGDAASWAAMCAAMCGGWVNTLQSGFVSLRTVVRA